MTGIIIIGWPYHVFADQMQMYMFMKNIAMAGGLLLLATCARTAFSI